MRLLALVLFLLPFPALAQIQCADRKDVVKHLREQFNESPMAAGVTSNGRIFELFVGPTTWTLIETDMWNMSCLVAGGEHWQQYPIKTGKEL